ncbi:hypothetical protein STAS_09790 [Striga asiatica]|uniref:Uncharacterized protein n=1 Tax=Striga asiatica TaxID=4170 RepID=A0A5A7PLL5_STRAF|nr:hypothetical protein STAS_09790 [Striga asiatica]
MSLDDVTRNELIGWRSGAKEAKATAKKRRVHWASLGPQPARQPLPASSAPRSSWARAHTGSHPEAQSPMSSPHRQTRPSLRSSSPPPPSLTGCGPSSSPRHHLQPSPGGGQETPPRCRSLQGSNPPLLACWRSARAAIAHASPPEGDDDDDDWVRLPAMHCSDWIESRKGGTSWRLPFSCIYLNREPYSFHNHYILEIKVKIVLSATRERD